MSWLTQWLRERKWAAAARAQARAQSSAQSSAQAPAPTPAPAPVPPPAPRPFAPDPAATAAFLNWRRDETADPAPLAAQVVPVSDRPTVSVIIPTYGQLDYTCRCLASIAAHPPTAPFEIIVID